MRRVSDRARLVAYSAAWAALALAVLVGLGRVEREDHSLASTALADLRVLQASLDRQLLHVRIDEAADPGALGPVVVSLEETASQLTLELERLGDSELAAVGGAYVEALRGTSAHVARYATLCAMWRAELRAWEVDEPQAGLRAPAARPEQRIERLQHLQQDLREELSAIDAAGLSTHNERLFAAYSRWIDARHSRSDLYRMGLFLISGLLFLHILRGLHQAQVRAAELIVANRALEERVQERARTLSSTNRALESAIAEARRSERDARRAREAAETASHTKSSFLANMSHEIRTPMTTILGYSERLLEPGLSADEHVEIVNTIRRSGEHLMQLVSDILDLSKIEAGWLTIERTPASPAQIVADVFASLLAKAQDKGLRLEVEWETKVPRTVRTDPLRLQQVLINLIGNAIKFTQRGRVLLSVSYQAGAGGGGSGHMVFSVQDTGIGMDEREIGRLFRPFSQADTSTTRRYGGTGLGLSICKHLVEALGGSIWVRSRKGEGSVFVVRIDAGPLEAPLVDGAVPPAEASAPAADVADRTLSGLAVLLCEDGDDNERLLRHFLERAGAVVTRAVDGGDAVEKTLAAVAAGRAFDVVLMDMQMPEVDGYEATRRLRAQGYAGPIVALTAHALVSDREACLAAGCDDYCSKPVRRSVLLELVARWGRRAVDADAGAPTRAAPPAALPARRATPAAPPADPEFEELVRAFVAELGPEVEAMRSALLAHAWDRLHTQAHRLKGAAGMHGFPEITRQARRLQETVDARLPDEEIAIEITALDRLCARARAQGATRSGDATPGNAPPRGA